jgi:hypothetical protein
VTDTDYGLKMVTIQVPPLFRTFSEEQRPDEEPLKFKSQSWMLHVGGRVSVEGILVEMIPCLAPLKGAP